jgi:protein BCP1
MSKRSAEEEYQSDTESTDEEMDVDEVVNVEFEFFDPREGDFHTIKRFWSQLLGPDQELLSTSALAEMVVAQKLIGTCIKVDGSESDPYAVLTVLNLTEHGQKAHIRQLVDYLVERCQKHEQIVQILQGAYQRQPGGWKDVAFLFSERLINMPVQLVPPMFKMLAEEIQWALEDHEPYEFEWYLLLSKIYREVAPTADDDLPDGPLPTGKRKKAKKELLTCYYHAEDEIIEQFAEFKHDFNFKKPAPVADAMRAFQERLYCIRREKMPSLLAALEKAINVT